MSPETSYWLEMVSLWGPLKSVAIFFWGADDAIWLMTIKRVFLLLPLAATAVAYWMSVLSLPTLIVRAERRHYLNTLLLTWWDLGRAVLEFWGGIFQFVARLGMALFSAIQVMCVGLWVALHDVVLIPVRVLANVSSSVFNPSVPWIAVALTLNWCVFEAIIFTYVMSPLIVDTLTNLTGDPLTENMIRIPMFGFMLCISVGSYAILSTWTQALKSKNYFAIVKISAIEAVALFVEVVFLYREFVDALVPWFAQHASGNFDLGVFGTLFIGGMTWVGIRSLSWFLFAAAGTPTIMAIIQGTGLSAKQRSESVAALKGGFQVTMGLVEQLNKEADWARTQGELLLGAFILPPLQIVAGMLNFCTVLFSGRHLFSLPFRSLQDLKDARTLLQESKERRRAA